jgi:hypothetical protein
MQSDKLLQNMVFNRTQVESLNTPPFSHTLFVCLYKLYFDTGKRGRRRVEPERRRERQQFTKLGRKYQHDQLDLQSINSDKHLPQSPFTGQSF